MKRKTLCWILCAVILLLCAPSASAEPEPDGATLSAREDGSYRVLLVADTQDTDRPQKAMLALLEAELDAADPDLVLFLGDVIFGPSIGSDREKTEAAITAVVEPVVRRGLPFAVCFGNHDDQDCLSKEEQLAVYRSFPGCLNEDPDIPGVGNTCLKLCAAGENSPSILLWLMDSGTYAEPEIGGYGYVTEEQNSWFREGVAALSDGNEPVSYVFQHIPVPQVFQLLREASPLESGAFCTFGNPFSQWYAEREGMVREGRFAETPCPPRYDSGQFQSWKDCGVRAAFFGHDHTNDFCAELEGIDLIATCGIGFYSYGRGDEHGARLLVLYPERPGDYETRMLYYRDLTDQPLNLLQAPHLGTQIRDILLAAALGLAVLAGSLAVLIRKMRKRRKKR